MFLKVKYDGKVQFIKICEDIGSEEFTPETILFAVLDKLKINTQCEISLRVRDGAEISVDQLLGVILQFMHCNCFFIAFDFALRYGEVASKRFLDNWSKYESLVAEISSEAGGGSSSDSFCDWSTEILPFLNLLRLLPSAGLGRARKKVNFQKSVDSFISLQDLNTSVAEYKVESHQPVILAVGQSKSSLVQYFINIDGKKINVPANYNFCQVFDLYFKSFYVFNIEFDAAIANFMQFFAKFLYGIDNQKKLTSRLIEVHSKFENKFKERLDKI